MSDCADILKKIIRNRNLNDISTNVLMKYFKREKYECLLYNGKCFLKQGNEYVDCDDFDPFATDDNFYANASLYPWIKDKPIAYINRVARELFYIQNKITATNNTAIGLQASDFTTYKTYGDYKGEETKIWTVLYLLENINQQKNNT